MKIEIEISNNEVNTIIEACKDQGVDVTVEDVREQMEEWFHATVEDFNESRIDDVIDALIDLGLNG
jgi:hypothetical protein